MFGRQGNDPIEAEYYLRVHWMLDPERTVQLDDDQPDTQHEEPERPDGAGCLLLLLFVLLFALLLGFPFLHVVLMMLFFVVHCVSRLIKRAPPRWPGKICVSPGVIRPAG